MHLRIRGSNGSRLAVDLDGLPLADPTSGTFDLAAIPFAFIGQSRLQTGTQSGGLAGRLGLETDEVLYSGVKARLGLGTMRTHQGSLWMNHVRDEATTFSGGVFWGSSNGQFLFRPSLNSEQTQVRVNNDQHRHGALAKIKGRIWNTIKSDFTALMSSHNGGIPGFATAPTQGLRGRHLSVRARNSLSMNTPLGGRTLSLKHHFQTISDRRSTHRPNGLLSHVSSHHAQQEFEGTLYHVLPNLHVGWTANTGTTFLLEQMRHRPQYGVGMNAEYSSRAQMLIVDARSHVQVIDQTFVPTFNLSTHLNHPILSPGLSIGHAGRAPTIQELYAPEGLVLGNPDLVPERVTDAELYLTLKLKRYVFIRLQTFAGYLHDSILYLNRNAYEVAPENTGPAARIGAEGKITVRPSPYFEILATGQMMASTLFDTGAPLPVSPPFSFRGQTRIGSTQGLHLLGAVRHQAGSKSNLFGTLEVAPYSLADLIAVWPFSFGLRLSIACTNLFNNQSARDVNLLPLPSRQLFAQMELEL